MPSGRPELDETASLQAFCEQFSQQLVNAFPCGDIEFDNVLELDGPARGLSMSIMYFAPPDPAPEPPQWWQEYPDCVGGEIIEAAEAVKASGAWQLRQGSRLAEEARARAHQVQYFVTDEEHRLRWLLGDGALSTAAGS